MNIEEKLTLTEQTPSVCFIKDSGPFCRLYNQSAYIVTQLFNRPLKVTVKSIKKLDHQKIIACGIPIKSVLNHFPNVVRTEWGFILKGDFDLTNYHAWREQKITLAENEAKQFRKEQAQKQINELKEIIHELDMASKFMLTPEQIAFLLSVEKAIKLLRSS